MGVVYLTILVAVKGLDDTSRQITMANYIQYNKHPKSFHNIYIRAANKEKYKTKSNIEKEEKQMLELDFGDIPEILMGIYLDVYEGNQSEY